MIPPLYAKLRKKYFPQEVWIMFTILFCAAVVFCCLSLSSSSFIWCAVGCHTLGRICSVAHRIATTKGMLPVILFCILASVSSAQAQHIYPIPHVSNETWKTTLTIINSIGQEQSCHLLVWEAGSDSAVQDEEILVPPFMSLRVSLQDNDWGVIQTVSDNLHFKLEYQFGDSPSASQFFLTEQMGTRWVLPNPQSPWLDWFGVVVLNHTESPLQAWFHVYYQGILVTQAEVQIPPLTKYPRMSYDLIEGLRYEDFDMIVITTSSSVSSPLSITGNDTQDRHLFFPGQLSPLPPLTVECSATL